VTTTANAYTFLSWLRRGIATQINQPPGSATRASVTVKLRVAGPAIAGGGTLTQDVQHDVALYGPGDVIGVDPRAIVRTDPRDQITNFEPNYLPFIEFYDEDFPWRYSPAVVDPATGRLAPWLALIVLADGEFTDHGTMPGRPLPFIELGSPATLPPADQLGAWAHVHVNGTVTASDHEVFSNDMAAVLPRLAEVLAPNPDLACSRLICPRRLEPQTGYHAFLVPAFETGRLAGLGLDPAGSPAALQSSWADYPSRPESASLGYYCHWQFRTSSVGDFEYLVRLLKPAAADGRVGHRDMDVRQPGTGLPAVTTDPLLGGVLWLGGALQAPDGDLTSAQQALENQQDAWDQPYPQPFQQALAALINLADDYTSLGVPAAHQNLPAPAGGPAPPAASSADPDPLVTPPLYGRWPARTSRLLTGPDGTPVTPDDNWVHELNLDPRFRVPAGTGGRVMRQHDEEYMQAAWDQLGDVLGANKRIRAAQFAREIGFALHAKQLAPLRQATPGRLFALSAPVQPRIALASAAAGSLTIAAHFADSLSAATPLSPAMRRVTRPGARLMRDLPFAAPAIIGGPADLAVGAADLAGSAGPPPGPDNLLARMNTGQVTAAADKTAPAGVVTVDALERRLSDVVVAHHEIQPHLVIDPGVVPNPVSELPTSSDFIISMPGDGVHPAGGGPDSTEAVLFKQALNETYTAFNSASLAGETPLRVGLDLTAAARATMDGLHPDLTVPRRALGGITLPGRLRPPAGGDPGGSDGVVGGGPLFRLAEVAAPAADVLAEVMACPVIDVPMFRPLADMSPDLFCPNVNLVAANSVTLLNTNRRFIESYLVGLNHEMARELLWREYPTDQRGSVFRQFWDVQSVLLPALPPPRTPDEQRERLRDIPPIDTWDPVSGLGTHNNRGPAAEDLVLVIRGELLKKYPTAVIYVQKAGRGGAGLEPVELTPLEEANPPPAKVRMPLFDAKLEPDIYFFGFDLTVAEALGGTSADPDDLGWFFIIKERPGDPRFGLDVESDENPAVWNDLAWPDVLPAGSGAAPAVYIPLDASTPTPMLPPLPPADVDQADQYAEDRELTWNGQINSADVAYILFRAPVLVAVHAKEMLRDA
jgi:hypothetical protein